MKSHNYYVYVLTNYTNNVFYTGVTNDLVRRVYGHKQKLVDGFTKKYNLTKLVFYEHTTSVTAAIEREKQIKKFRRSKKMDLIKSFNPSWDDLYQNIV